MLESGPAGLLGIKTSDVETKKELLLFIDFIKEGNYSAEQLREAYYRFCGVSQQSERDDPAIVTIVEKMKEMSDNHFPINYFAEIAGLKEHHEDLSVNFKKYIEELTISNREKRVLISIIEKKRSGNLEFFVNNEHVAVIKIDAQGIDIDMLAYKLLQSIQKVVREIPAEATYEFSFSEN